jgi:S-adenosylmethionine hydrolase
MQEGYGFITVPTAEEAGQVAQLCQHVTIDGITVVCSLTHKAKRKYRATITHQYGAVSWNPEMNLVPNHLANTSMLSTASLPVSTRHPSSHLYSTRHSNLQVANRNNAENLEVAVLHESFKTKFNLSDFC